MNLTIITQAHLAADAEYVPNPQDASKNRANFTVCSNYTMNGQQLTDTVRCTAWGRQADSINTWMKEGRFLKGCKVEVRGTEHLNKYVPKQGKNAGQEVASLELSVQSCYSDVSANIQNQQPQNQWQQPVQPVYQQPDYNYAQNGASVQQNYSQTSQQGRQNPQDFGTDTGPSVQQNYIEPAAQQSYNSAQQNFGNYNPNGQPPAQQGGFQAARNQMNPKTRYGYGQRN